MAEGLRLKELPKPADAARPTRQDLKPSPALSILLNGPKASPAARSARWSPTASTPAILEALKAALEAEGAMLKLVAPKVGGVEASDGSWHRADEKIDGGPSVLFDAVVLLPSADGAAMLAKDATARDFVADAFAHLKFIGYAAAAEPLLKKAGVFEDRDEGCLALKSAPDAETFVAACRKLRFWAREPSVKQV